METITKKRVARPVKPKIVKEASPVAVVVPAAEPLAAEPVDQPSPPAAELPSDELPVVELPADAAEEKHQSAKQTGVNISGARVRRHLDKFNLNLVLDVAINALKSQVGEYDSSAACLESGTKTHTTPNADKKLPAVVEVLPLTEEERTQAQETVNRLSADVAELRLKLTALSRERTRFSNSSHFALSIICDELIQQLVTYTMDRVLLVKKKIIQVSHLHEAGVEKLSLFPLVKTLPTFVAMSAQLAKVSADAADAVFLKSTLDQAEKDFKKKYDVKSQKKKKTEEAVVESVADAEESEEDLSDSKTSFKFCVHKICKDLVKKDAQYKSVRVSTEIRAYLSSLLIELIHRLSGLVLLTTNSMKNKTVSDVAILRTVESLLVDGHSAQETIEYKEAEMPNPESLKAEVAKTEAEKAAGRSYKFDASKLPTVKGLVAVRTVQYPTSGFAALGNTVLEKLALYKQSGVPEKLEEDLAKSVSA